MDIKRKTCDIRTWKRTFISRHILHQHWDTCPIVSPVCWNPQHRSLLTVVSAISTPLFQPLCRQWNVYHPVVNRFTWQTLPTINRKHLWISFALSPFAHKKHTIERCSSVVHPQAWLPVWLLKPASEHVHVHLLPRLSWSWTVLLPSDTHRKPMTSITAVLLPAVTYLLTLPRI
jgi:hypothetical protein